MTTRRSVPYQGTMPESPTGAIFAPNTTRHAIEQGERNRTRFLDALRKEDAIVWRALEASNVTAAAYRTWRLKHPGFAMKVDSIKQEVHRHQKPESSQRPSDFAGYRKRYFGFDSPDHHLLIIDALENSPNGSVTLILLPPEHGKTTVLEDWMCKKLDDDPDYRITIGSEKQTHGKKMIARVKARMEPSSGPMLWLNECGPFAPQPGDRRPQTWAEDRIHVYGRTSDERDYSIIAQGVTSSVVGTRADLLLVDDIQSRKSLSASAEIFGNLRQDWLSRTGAFGRVVIVGTRVGPGDVYELLMESPIVNRVIEIPAYRADLEVWDPPTGHNPKEDPEMVPDHITTFVWPERYAPIDYLVMRVNAGEEGWNRNFMQRGEAAGAQPFTDDILALASRAEFSCAHLERCVRYPGELVVTLDPGFGVNCTMLSLMTGEFVLPLVWRKDPELTNNQQIWQILEEVMWAGKATGSDVSEVVIEDKAFQKGLLEDEGLLALRKRFRFSVYGHQTGENKYDPDLGIPQMPRAMDRGEILLPDAPDEMTHAARLLLDRELKKWRPYKRGNRLTQDLVITLWFAWMTWRRIRHLLGTDGRIQQSWQAAALPSSMRTTASGLHLPTGSYRSA